VDRFGEVIARIQANGMAVSAGIIFGHDSDTLDTFRRLRALVARDGVDSPVYTILTPLPGTDLWARLEAEGRLRLGHLPEDYARLDAHHVAFEPLHLSADALRAANREAVREATAPLARARGLWRTWRRTGSLLAALASFQNNRWARSNSH
jgi:hypothetical protein